MWSPAEVVEPESGLGQGETGMLGEERQPGGWTAEGEPCSHQASKTTECPLLPTQATAEGRPQRKSLIPLSRLPHPPGSAHAPSTSLGEAAGTPTCRQGRIFLSLLAKEEYSKFLCRK